MPVSQLMTFAEHGRQQVFAKNVTMGTFLNRTNAYETRINFHPQTTVFAHNGRTEFA